MAQVSSAVTAGVGLSATTIQPIVDWAIMGFHTPMPAMLPGAITSAVLFLGHYALNKFTKTPDAPKTQGVTQ